MDIRLLKYFLMVAEEGNVTKAAEKLHITQPTLSRQLRQLEEDLGISLLLRGKRNTTLTQAGLLFRRRAEEIVELAERTEQEFREHYNLTTGEIFIGSGEVDAMHLLAKVMRTFRHDYPKVKFHMYSGNADDIMERIDNGLLDLGLLTEPVDVGKYAKLRLPSRERWGVLMRSDSHLADKEYVEPADLAELPLLISRRRHVQELYAQWFGDAYEQLDIVGTYNLLYNAAVMVEEGLGYAFSLENLVTIKEGGKFLFKPLRPAVEIGSVLVWKKGQVHSPATAKFLEQLHHAFEA